MGTAPSRHKMMASRHFIAEALGGISLVGVLTFAAQWGTLNQMVSDHVDPTRHGQIVLAGSVETGEKIAVIETKLDAIVDDIDEAKTEREQVKEDVAETKGDVKLLLELQRRLLDNQTGGSP